MPKLIDLTGATFGRLTVQSRIPGSSPTKWLCECSCGSKNVEVFGINLHPRPSRTPTTSCGCVRREVMSEIKTKHGHSRKSGWRSTYWRWNNMKARCTNPKDPEYKNYGARGISYDPRWEEYTEFLEDMGEAPEGRTLERRDNDLGYSKDNCYWATPIEQGRNKRTNHKITFRRRTGTISQWAEWTGLEAATIRQRLVRGESVKSALTTPVRTIEQVSAMGHSERWS